MTIIDQVKCSLFSSKALHVLFFLIVGGSTVVDAANPADGPEIATDYTSFGRKLSAEETIKTLELIAMQTEANFRQIHTCTGLYDFVDRNYSVSDFSSVPRQFPNDLQDDESIGKFLTDTDLPVGDEPPRGTWYVNTGSVEFFWNVDQDKVHSVYHHANWLGCVDAKSRLKKRAGILPYSVSWTITPDGVLEFDSSERRGPLSVPSVNDEHQQIGPIIYRRTFREAQRKNARLVDVRKFFSTGGSSPWETCHNIVQSLDADSPDESHKFALNNIFVFTTDQSPPVITLVLNHSETTQRVLVFDGASGFNITSFTYVKEGRVKQHEIVEYKNRDGIFFPQNISLKHFQNRSDRVRLDGYRSFDLKDLVINGSIEESSFTLAAYAVPHGTRMLDEISDELSVFDEVKKRFVPISEFR